ncbi:hypothetical protein P4O66_018077 [Electrophorus voltai]|uniref:Uncharacterized protein n=1 Tax=Electrophorus voltai TaxID=2609070 RepID=A0AAD8YS73_9TELE|nr:hypothetical protein P4O66_018077 [Electrophorus voltai]
MKQHDQFISSVAGRGQYTADKLEPSKAQSTASKLTTLTTPLSTMHGHRDHRLQSAGRAALRLNHTRWAKGQRNPEGVAEESSYSTKAAGMQQLEVERSLEYPGISASNDAASIGARLTCFCTDAGHPGHLTGKLVLADGVVLC